MSAQSSGRNRSLSSITRHYWIPAFEIYATFFLYDDMTIRHSSSWPCPFIIIIFLLFFTLIVIARTNGGVRAGGFFSPVIYEPLLPTLAAASIAGQSQRFTCSFLPFVFDSFLPIPPPARFPTIYFDDSAFVFISFAFWPFVFFFVDGHLFYSSPRVLIQFDPHSLQHR